VNLSCPTSVAGVSSRYASPFGTTLPRRPTQEIVRDLIRRSVSPLRSPDKRSLNLRQPRPQSITLVTCFRHAGFVTEEGEKRRMCGISVSRGRQWGRGDATLGKRAMRWGRKFRTTGAFDGGDSPTPGSSLELGGRPRPGGYRLPG
jgi:hypothetical protein